MFSRRFKIVLGICAAGAILLLGMLAATALVLPPWVESKLIPDLTRKVGLSPSQIHVRRIGWWGTDIGPIEFQTGGAPAMAISAIQIDYSPLSLTRGRILGVTLGGIDLRMEAGKDGIQIPGMVLPPPKKDMTGGQKPTAPDLNALLPIQLDRFSIRQSQVKLKWKGRTYSIPLEMAIDGSQLRKGKLMAQADISVLGNPLTLAAKWDQTANRAQVEFTGKGILLQSLALTGRFPADVHD